MNGRLGSQEHSLYYLLTYAPFLSFHLKSRSHRKTLAQKSNLSQQVPFFVFGYELRTIHTTYVLQAYRKCYGPRGATASSHHLNPPYHPLASIPPPHISILRKYITFSSASIFSQTFMDLGTSPWRKRPESRRNG